MKECFKCHTVQPLENFYNHPQMPDGHVNKCKECNKKDVRDNYKKRRSYYTNYDNKRQRHSIKRILSHRYNSLRARCDNDYAASKGHNYTATGMAYLSKEDFMDWASNTMDVFMPLYNEWALGGYKRSLCPSVDRINGKQGYTKDNIQWLTVSKNSSKRKYDIQDFREIIEVYKKKLYDLA